MFRSSCYILRNQENLHKFDSKSDEKQFLGYSSHNKACKGYNTSHVISISKFHS